MKQFFGLMRGQLSAAGLAFGILLAASLSLRAQTAPEQQQQQGPPIIKSVEIQYVGPQTLSREKVLSQMRTKPGQPYSEGLVEQDIKTLYRTGQVQNVRIFGQAEGDPVTGNLEGKPWKTVSPPSERNDQMTNGNCESAGRSQSR